MDATRARARADDRERLLPPLFGILAPLALWAVRLAASYVLVPYACWRNGAWALHGVTLLTLAGCVGAGVVAWRVWRRAGGPAQVETGGPAVRRRFMGLLGMLLAAFFGTVIVAEGLANLMIDPCITWGAPVEWVR
jgi:hypothetical protein